MNVKWKIHELLLVTSATLLGMARLTAEYFGRPKYLLPQAGSLLLLCLAWLALNYLAMPMAVKALKKRSGRWLGIAGALAQLLALSYILGPVVNFVSFYAGPGYVGFTDTPLSFGFHPQPVLNVFGGWGVSVTLVCLYGLYAAAREAITHYLERPGITRNYRVLASNKVTAFSLAVLELPVVLAVFELASSAFFRFYFALVPSAGMLIILLYYRVFPEKDLKGWRDPGFLVKILVTAASLTILFSPLLGAEWTVGWVACCILLQLVLVVPLAWFFYRGRKDTLQELMSSQTELARSNADLQALRSQINPHFLFNALNALYGTALREGSATTAAGIQQLGDMMRFMLHDNNQDLIAMHSELEYLRNYIALQRLRLPESADLVIDVDIDDIDCGFLIAPMLLIPFVENAFKHGLRLERRSWIKIRLRCSNGELIFQISNSLHRALAHDTEQGRSGVGLENVRGRLSLLYPGRHELHHGPEAESYVVHLKLNCNS